MQRERYRIADLIVDVGAVSVVRQDGQAVPLPQLSFDLLVALARRAPDVVSADELIATIWAGVAVSDETLTQRVALLRRALGDEAKSPRYLRAVRGRGYQLVPEVRALAEGEEQSRRRRIAPALAAIILVALGIPTALFFSRDHAPAAVSTRSPSVTELLERAGTYLRQHQESDNELAVELYGRALGLEPKNPRALAGLSLALAQRATKFNRRGDEGDRALELAHRALGIDPRLGLAHHALGLALDGQGQVRTALAAYLRAAELEPEPTSALASAANLLQVQGQLARALETNLRAARGGGDAPNYLEVQLGTTLALLGFEQASAVWFERALELRPDNVFAAAAYARMRLSQGRPREADEIAGRAIERGIRRPELSDLRGTVALMEGDEPRARAFFQDALAIDPGFGRARTRLLLLDQESGGSDLERRYRQLKDEIRQGRAGGDEWPDSAIDEMLLETGFGHPDAALQALDAAIGLGYRDGDWLLLDPMLAGLRGNPGLIRRIGEIRHRIDAERQGVLGAAWLPPSFLGGSAAKM
ncbi:MAG TPA: winged helix-turn-helix domain-containing protein [Thermoanaerobaculia bacterium]|nr:winged helix-turn-helix domain-containing protein [Thermoanaerobaculia bacterium]